MSPNALWKMLIEVYHDWSDVKASRLAAALAFYTILSLAPILIIVISIAGFAFASRLFGMRLHMPCKVWWAKMAQSP